IKSVRCAGVWIGNLIGPASREAISIQETESGGIDAPAAGHSQRQAAVRVHDTRQLPTAQKMSGEALLAPVERQFVDITHGEYVAPIECTLAAFVGETVAVLWRAEIRLRV